MGCCASSNSKADATPHHHSAAARSDASSHSKTVAVPPEEETVKEVLSETPIAKIEDEEKQRGFRPSLRKIQEQHAGKNVNKKMPLMNPEEVSEVSEICSLSEVSFSTEAEKREDDGGEEVRRRVMNRSPVKFRNRTFPGERRDRRTAETGKSPARRSEPSPGRVRLVPGRESRVEAADGKRRDLGESSGRRSRSPAVRAAESGGGRLSLGRSPSVRKTGKSPGRLPEKTRKFEENENEHPKWPPPTANESLENPLVSLECFIFL